MTKAAVLRRKCRRAKRAMMRRWPNVYTEECFETVENDGCYPGLLPGTVIFWHDCGDGEADYEPASRQLRHMVMVETTNWDRLAREMEIRTRFGGRP